MLDDIMEFVKEYHVLAWGAAAFVVLFVVGSLRAVFPNCKIFKK